MLLLIFIYRNAYKNKILLHVKNKELLALQFVYDDLSHPDLACRTSNVPILFDGKNIFEKIVVNVYCETECLKH